MKFSEEKPKKKLHMVSLGCTKNLVDSEVMFGKPKDYELTDDDSDADSLILNTSSAASDVDKRQGLISSCILSKLWYLCRMRPQIVW